MVKITIIKIQSDNSGQGHKEDGEPLTKTNGSRRGSRLETKISSTLSRCFPENRTQLKLSSLELLRLQDVSPTLPPLWPLSLHLLSFLLPTLLNVIFIHTWSSSPWTHILNPAILWLHLAFFANTLPLWASAVSGGNSPQKTIWFHLLLLQKTYSAFSLISIVSPALLSSLPLCPYWTNLLVTRLVSCPPCPHYAI